MSNSAEDIVNNARNIQAGMPFRTDFERENFLFNTVEGPRLILVLCQDLEQLNSVYENCRFDWEKKQVLDEMTIVNNKVKELQEQYGTDIARVVEGCNAISVMILFAAFIFAFSARWHKTILYIFIGIILLHVLNCIRIALLCFSLFHYKQYSTILHGTIFPLIIYGAVFVLWILWVTNYSGYGKATKK